MPVLPCMTGRDMLQVLRLGAPVTALSLSPAGDLLGPKFWIYSKTGRNAQVNLLDDM